MRMSWHDLLFAHAPVPVAALRAVVPPGLDVDTFDGVAWLGVVPFRMTRVGPRVLPPLPGLHAFPDLNVRTYVTRATGNPASGSSASTPPIGSPSRPPGGSSTCPTSAPR